MNNNVLYVGDMHCKQTVILPYVDRVIQKYNVKEVVFLGDYVDEFGVRNDARIEQLCYQVSWYNKATSNGLSVTNVIGNHDMAYLKGDGLCSGYVSAIQPEIKALLTKLNPVITSRNHNVVSSHAGFTQTWNNTFNAHFNPFNEHNTGWKDIVSDNNLYRLVVSVGPSRGGWPGNVPGPLWCDATELVKDMCSEIPFQVVGHTPVRTVEVHDDMKIAFCDTFSCDFTGDPFGDGSMLVINQVDVETSQTSHFVVKPSDVGLGTWKEMTWQLVQNRFIFRDVKPRSFSFVDVRLQTKPA